MKEIYAALANFQQEIGTLPKDASGYGYKYTELSTIVEKALPLLKKHGLGFTQPMSGTAVKTILFHAESGESIESSLDIPQGVELKGMNEYQALGSAITYLRRYSLASILGIVTDEDTDAQGEQTGKHAYKPSTGGKATEKQLNLIRTLARQQGMPDEALEARIAMIETSQEASEAISKLKGEN